MSEHVGTSVMAGGIISRTGNPCSLSPCVSLYIFTTEGKTEPPSRSHSNSPKEMGHSYFSALSLAGGSAALTGFPFTAPLWSSSRRTTVGWCISLTADQKLGRTLECGQPHPTRGCGEARSCNTSLKRWKGLWGTIVPVGDR